MSECCSFDLKFVGINVMYVCLCLRQIASLFPHRIMRLVNLFDERAKSEIAGSLQGSVLVREKKSHDHRQHVGWALRVCSRNGRVESEDEAAHEVVPRSVDMFLRAVLVSRFHHWLRRC